MVLPRRIPFLLALTLASAAAGPASAMEGRVVSKVGTQPIADAEVAILGRTGSVRTDADGRFRWTPDPRPPFEVLVVLTDGDDSTSAIGQGELLELVRSSGVTIYPISFSAGFPAGSSRGLKAKAFLMGLADLSGGHVYTPHASRDLAEVYQKILDELSSQYVLGFTPTDTPRDGKHRKLKVEVKGKDLDLRHRAGYRAPRG